MRAYGDEEDAVSSKSERSRREYRQESRSQANVDKDNLSQKLSELKVDTNVEVPNKDGFKKEGKESIRR